METVEIRDGVPTLVYVTEKVERPRTEAKPLVYESGGIVRSITGTRMVQVPVMEDVEEIEEVQVIDGTRLGLRYEQCLVFEIAYLRSEAAYLRSIVSTLTDRVAILEG